MLYLVFPTPTCRSCHETMKNTTPSSWISALKKSLSLSKRSCLSDSTSQQPQAKEQETATCTKGSTCLCLVRPTRDNEKNSSKPNIHAISEEENDGLLMQTTLESLAAIRIQTAFRMYLARKALRSLKALVKLQALVRGSYVRKRTELTLKCLASLLRIQERSRTQRLMSLNGFRSSDHDIDKAKEFLASSPSSTQAADSESDTDIHENQGHSIEEILATYAGQRQTVTEDFVLDEKVASKRIQITRVNTKIAHRNDRSISAPRTPMKLSKCSNTLTNSHVRYQNAEFSTPMPRTPNYMASTESARAKMNRNRNKGTSSVPPVPSVCSTSNSPRQVKLFTKSTLPPVRTSRSNTGNSSGKCHEEGMSIMSPGESRKLVRKLMVQERPSSKYAAGIH